MCGIAGSWSRLTAESTTRRLTAALAAIRHRGPDDQGTYAWENERNDSRVDLGMVRLAILDLSDAGHQPMRTPDGRYVITFNGEITNYVEIRDELVSLGVTFESSSDTEVLLKAWAQWGLTCLARLEGMYAFAVLDTHEHTLTLVRDPFGIKPLFIAHEPQTFAFCSELQGLLAIRRSTPRLDWQTAVDYLQWSVVDHTERTFVQGVSQLAPGHYAVLDTNTGNLSAPQRFWTPPVARSFEGTYAEAVDAVRQLFLESVRRNLRSDVPLGIALSGGIDSSAIAGAVRYLEPDMPISTFSFIAPGFAESEHDWVDLMVRAIGAESHTVTATAADLERDLDDLIQASGEPFGSTSIYAQYNVFRLARECGVTVTLDGQGGDELFAGYDGYPEHRMKSLIETGRWVSAMKFARAWADWPGRSQTRLAIATAGQFVPHRFRGRVIATPLSPLLNEQRLRDHGVDVKFPMAPRGGIRGRRLASRLASALTREGLPSLLRNGDRNSMHFSIESRVPFLDRALAEVVLGLPEEWLVSADGRTKHILRDAVRSFVPKEIVDRKDKIGFSTPEDTLLRRLARRPIDDSGVVGFINTRAGEPAGGGTDEAAAGLGIGGHWRLVNLHRWVELNQIDAR